jgi:hypothetical protein
MRSLSKKCAECGRAFTGNYAHGKEVWRKRRYCSVKCKRRASVGRTTAECLTKSCEQCGRKFRNRRASGRVIEPCKWAKARFCSPGCKQASQRGHVVPWLRVEKEDLKTRFMRHVEKEDDGKRCWLWVGTKNKAGYGGIQVNGKRALVHRISYMLHHGAIPEGVGFHGHVVCHACDNPSCVNPGHLFLGSQYTNMQDRDAKGRRAALIGSQHGMASLSEEDVKTILEIAATGRYTQTKIGKMFGVSNSTVSLIVNRKNWTHI